MFIEYLKHYPDFKGPFDGILGFSQGAAFTQLLLHVMESDSGTLF